MRIFWAAIVPSLVSAAARGASGRRTGSSRAAAAGARSSGRRGRELLEDLRDATRTHGPATLADGEAQALLHGDRLDQHDAHLGVVARHDHLRALGEGHDAGHVRGAEVELRAVVVEERGVATTLVLAQDVDLRLELGVRGGRARLHHDLATLDVLALDTAQQQADVLTGTRLVEDLAEHLDAGDGRRGDLGVDTDDLDRLTGLEDTPLDAAGDHGAATGDGEDVLDRHEERLVGLALRLRDGVVARVHQLHELVRPLLVALQRLQRRDTDDRDVVARELVGRQELTYLELDQLEDLLVVDHVGLVQRHHDVGHTDLAREQHVLLGLRHRAVGRRHDQDRAVHLRGTRDHVLDVVGVTGTVDVRVVALVGLVLDVRDGDGDAAGLLLRRLVDLVERREGVQVRVLLVKHLRDRGRQRRLAMVDVTDGADVDVRLVPLELRLRHWVSLLGTVVRYGRRTTSSLVLGSRGRVRRRSHPGHVST